MQCRARNTMRVAATFVALAIIPGPANAAETGADETGTDETRVLPTASRGRPPFKRVGVTTPEAADFARLEANAAADSGPQPVDYRGRPPFARRAASADDSAAADFARFEEATDRKPRRRGPPGKMTSSR